jgi:hypothetical protein
MSEDWFDEPEVEPTNEPWDFPLERRRTRKRVVASASFVVLFFAGAAFTAGAGDLAASKLQGSDPCAQQANAPTAADEQACAAAPTTADATPTPPSEPPPPAAPADPAVAPAPAAPAPTAESTDPAPGSVGTAAKQAVASVPAIGRIPTEVSTAAPAPAPAQPSQLKRWIAPTPKHAAPAPEIEGVGAPTIWLNAQLPDPTPPAKRLTARFASELASTAKAAGVDWELVLGVLRAGGDLSAVPATDAELGKLSERLAALGAAKDEWSAVLALDGRATFADQAVALAHYDRAVGLWALVHGLEAAKQHLAEQVLNDPAVTIYVGGRSDLSSGRIDVRVIAVIAYLRETFGSVTVSCLITGHGLYARPGVISAHIYGRAVDIAAVGGTSIFGNQEPGGITEKAVRAILLLPSELQPQQVISLLGLGGPSFPLADHFDHIHVGY